MRVKGRVPCGGRPQLVATDCARVLSGRVPWGPPCPGCEGMDGSAAVCESAPGLAPSGWWPQACDCGVPTCPQHPCTRIRTAPIWEAILSWLRGWGRVGMCASATGAVRHVCGGWTLVCFGEVASACPGAHPQHPCTTLHALGPTRPLCPTRPTHIGARCRVRSHRLSTLNARTAYIRAPSQISRPGGGGWVGWGVLRLLGWQAAPAHKAPACGPALVDR
jgi:hypothetical protein